MLFFNENYRSIISTKTHIIEFLNKEWKVIRFLPGRSLLQLGAATFTAYLMSKTLPTFKEPLTSKKKLIKTLFPVTLFGLATYLMPEKVSLIAATCSYLFSKIILNLEQSSYKAETPSQAKDLVFYPELEKRGIVIDQKDDELYKKLISILEKMDCGLDPDKHYNFFNREEFLESIIIKENIRVLELLVDNRDVFSVLFKNVNQDQSGLQLQAIWNCPKEEVVLCAMKQGLYKIVAWCLRKNYPVSYIDLKTGATLLHHAALEGNAFLINLLLSSNSIDAKVRTKSKLPMICLSHEFSIPEDASYEFIVNVYNFCFFYLNQCKISNKTIREFYLGILDEDNVSAFSSLFKNLLEIFLDEEERNKAIRTLFDGYLYIDCSPDSETALLIYALSSNCPTIQKWLSKQSNLKFISSALEKENERVYFYRNLIKNDSPVTVEAFIHLLKQDKKHNEVFEETEKKIFSQAVEADACEIVKLFCKKGYAVNMALRCKNEDLLYHTIEDGLFKITEWLIEKGYSLNYRDKVNGASLLHYAAGKKAGLMIALLLDKGADPTVCTTDNFWFCCYNFGGITLPQGLTYTFIESVNQYIDSISSFYDECNEHLLMEGSSKSIPAYFIEFINEDNLEGFSQFYSKLREKFTNISQRNIALKAFFNYENDWGIFEDIVRANSSKIIGWWLQNHPEDFGAVNELCLEAAQSGKEKTTLFFYEQLHEKEISDEYGRTPLHLLALHQKKDACNKLIEMGANKNAKTQTPSPFIREGIKLQVPADSTYRIILMMHRLFLEFEPKPKSSQELLENIMQSYNIRFFTCLKSKIIEMFPDSSIDSLFLQALRYKRKEILIILLKESPVSQISSDALRQCAFTYGKKASRSMMKLLFNYGFNPATCDENGMSLLHAAAFSGDTAFIDFLLKKGVPTSCKTTEDVFIDLSEQRSIVIKKGATYDIFVKVCFSEMARLVLIKKISNNTINYPLDFKIFEQKKLEELLQIFIQVPVKIFPGERTLLDIASDQLEILFNDWLRENNRFFYHGCKEISCINHLKIFELLLTYGADPLVVFTSLKTPYRRFCDLLQKVESNSNSFVLIELMEETKKLMQNLSCIKLDSIRPCNSENVEVPREIAFTIAGYMWDIKGAFPNDLQK